MSVINKMLRDLDSRLGAGTRPAPNRESPVGMANGTVIVKGSTGAGRRRGSWRIGAVIAAAVTVLGAAAGTWWYVNQNQFLQRRVEPVKLVVPAVAPVAAASSVSAMVDPDAVAPVVISEQTPVAARASANQLGAAPTYFSLKMDDHFRLAPSHIPSSRPDAAGPPRVLPGRPMPERPMNERPVKLAPTTPAAVINAPPSPPRRSPALDALAQAQSLWSSGSHDTAIDLLQEALAAAERAHLAGMSAGNNSVLASLARELARMDLAEGRVSPALEMLTRLEPSLSGFADVWAIRGNAAQRLGRHSESAAAYLMALKLRPGEPRWMLGAAVSLAAQGKTASAADLAEKARVGGALSPEVATYLRQLGVPLRER